MAITLHGFGTSQSKAAGTTLATSTAVFAGDLIVVAFASDDAAGTYSCADTDGNTYVQDITQKVNAGHVRLTVFRAVAAIEQLTEIVTVTHPSLTARAVFMMVFTGAATSSPLDVTAAGATGASTTPTSGSVTPSANNYLVIGAIGVEHSNNDAITQDPAFTSLSTTKIGTTGGGTASNIYVAVGYNIQTTATARNYSPTIVSASWADTALVYKVLASGIQNTLTVTGSLTFTGAQTKRPAKALSAGLTFSGAIPLRAVTHGMSAALTFSGVAVRAIRHTLPAAALTFSGSLLKRTSKTLSGGVSFVGTIPSRAIGKVMPAALTFSGTAVRAITHGLPAAALTFSGSALKRTSRTVSGALSFIGSVVNAKIFLRTLTAALTFSGGLTKRANKALTGSLTFSGAILRAVTHGMSAALTFSGTAVRAITHGLSAAILSFSGGVTKRVSRTLAGSLSFSGTIVRAVSHALSAALTFSGTVLKQTSRAFSATVSFVGGLTSGKSFTRTFTAALSFSGGITKQVSRTLAAGLTFGGALTKQTARLFSGGLTFAGVFTAIKSGGGQLFTQTLTATLSFSGGLGSVLSRAAAAIAEAVGPLIRPWWDKPEFLWRSLRPRKPKNSDDWLLLDDIALNDKKER